MTAIDTVLFDYCGVLAEASGPPEMAELAAVIGADQTLFTMVYWRHRNAYDRNAIDAASYWRTVGADCGVSIEDDHIPELISIDIRAHTRVFGPAMRLAGEIAAGGRTVGILSDLPTELADEVRQQSAWKSVVRAFTFSCDSRVAKPNPESFAAALHVLDATHETTLFVDDRPENVHAAHHLGLPAVHWRGDTAAVREYL